MNPLLEKSAQPDEIAHNLLGKPAALEVFPPNPYHSFRSFSHDFPTKIAGWHYHPEFEIHLIREGSGSYLIGDAIGTFQGGHVAFIGSGLPHDWMSDLEPNQEIKNRDGVIQFLPEFIAELMETMPELRDLKPLLKESSHGVIYHGETAKRAAKEIEAIISGTGTRRILHLLALLVLFAEAPKKEKQLITRQWFTSNATDEGRLAVESGIKYIFDNLTTNIRMSEAAKLAYMSEPTFSKYFKKASGLTFSDMVRKMRIAHACRLLEDTKDSISSICVASGYANLANFNRQFLAEMDMTPSIYRSLDDQKRLEKRNESLGVVGGGWRQFPSKEKKG
jgi:AraC-like DNA-binding protein